MSFALNHKIMQYYVRVSVQMGVSNSNPPSFTVAVYDVCQQSLSNQVAEN